MTSVARSELHPDVQKVMDIFNDLNVPDFYKKTPEEARAIFRGLRADPDTLPPIHATEDVSIAVDGGEIALRIYRPDASAGLPVMMWFHGGGWVFGDLDSGELACREMASQAGCAIISVDYRLAPEYRFPVALDDCIAATHWVIDNAARLGLDASRLAVGGDSAGGNLAASTAQYARDNDITLTHQVLVYPVTQPAMDTPSYEANATGYFLSRDSMAWFWDHYAPDTTQRDDARVSPLKGNLAGLAPAWVMTCGFDPLCSDGELYANALSAAGVAVNTCHRDDSIHGVFGMAIIPGTEARREAAQSLKAAFGSAA